MVDELSPLDRLLRDLVSYSKQEVEGEQRVPNGDGETELQHPSLDITADLVPNAIRRRHWPIGEEEGKRVGHVREAHKEEDAVVHQCALAPALADVNDDQDRTDDGGEAGNPRQDLERKRLCLGEWLGLGLVCRHCGGCARYYTAAVVYMSLRKVRF